MKCSIKTEGKKKMTVMMQKSYKDTYPNISIIILINLRSLNHQFKEIYVWLFLHSGEMEIYKNKLECFQG